MAFLKLIFCGLYEYRKEVIIMAFYFREKDLAQLSAFYSKSNHRAMVIYGRCRMGKTTLVLKFIEKQPNCVYFQVSAPNSDYALALSDFKNTVSIRLGNDPIIAALSTFKDLFTYLGRVQEEPWLYIIDEFPYLAQKHKTICGEFQWIIDHGLGNNKLILMGSSRSFMKNQIQNQAQPLYGRFDEILEVLPFTYNEVHQLFPNDEDAMNVYAMTNGVAQYVMFFMEYSSVSEAIDNLLLRRNGRLLYEPTNMLRQELRDIGTFVRILRTIGSAEKGPAEIAEGSDVDSKAIYQYLNRLEDLQIIEPITNLLPGKKIRNKRYRIKDLFFRFMYTFIEPNLSVIFQLEKDARPYVFGQQYQEYLGFVYEDLVRSCLYTFASDKIIPFMPTEIGKWWGNVQNNGVWAETEVDVLALDREYALIGECKYRTKKIGIKELELLKTKAAFIPTKGRKLIFMLASKEGFTDEVQSQPDVLLIENTKPLNRIG